MVGEVVGGWADYGTCGSWFHFLDVPKIMYNQ